MNGSLDNLRRVWRAASIYLSGAMILLNAGFLLMDGASRGWGAAVLVLAFTVNLCWIALAGQRPRGVATSRRSA
ncbi:MAG: hypothetical protein HZA52_14185 [Planctomycetes bacterium]|nr:hypothetical protein [Planctomycetota bacterium]